MGWDGMVFKVSPVIVDGDGGWCIPCNDVTGKGDNVAIERGPVGVGEVEFSMPQRTLMWRVCSSTRTRRVGLSCHGKDARMFILSDIVAPPLYWRSKIAGYAAK